VDELVAKFTSICHCVAAYKIMVIE